MATSYFAFGLLTAVVFAAAVIALLCLHLKRTRHKPSAIRGYLDLIPDLTAEQSSRVQEIRRVFLPKVDKIRQDLRLERAQLAELLFTESPDTLKIQAVAEQILQHQSQLETEVIDHILEEKEILSRSQRREFYEIIIKQFASGGLGVHDVRGDE